MVYIYYHSADLDGKASNQIIKEWAKRNKQEFMECPWNYGDKEPVASDFKSGVETPTIVMADICFSMETMLTLKFLHTTKQAQILWFDHHKSAIENSIKYEYDILPGKREIGKAACRITYEELNPSQLVPEAIELLSAYDVWDKENAYYDWDYILAYQYGARANESLVLNSLTEGEGGSTVYYIHKIGESVLRYQNERDAYVAKNGAFEAKIDGYNAICINTWQTNSTAFESVYNPDNHHLMVPFRFGSNGKVLLSFYTTHDSIDVSEIAKKFGGGGHKAAAGCEIDMQQATSLIAWRRLCSPIEISI